MINGASSLYIDKILKILVGFVSSIVIANKYTQTEFGEYSLALLTYSLCIVICNYGLDPLLFNRLIVRKNYIVLEESIIFRLRLTLAVIPLIFLILNFSSPSILYLLSPLFILLPLYSFSGFKELLFARSQFLDIFYAGLVSSICIALSTTLLLFADLSLLTFLFLFTFSKALEPIFLYYRSKYHINYSKIFTIVFSNKHLKYSKFLTIKSFPLLLTTLIAIIYGMQDAWILESYLGPAAVGIYLVGVKSVTSISFFPSIVSNFLYLKLRNKYDSNIILSKVNVLFTLVFFVAGLLVLAAYILGFFLIELYPEAFADAFGVMKIYVWILFPIAFNSIIAKLLINDKLEKIILIKNIIALASNLFLNILLIPAFALKGAAFSTLISELLSFLVIYAFPSSRKYLKIFLYSFTCIFKRSYLLNCKNFMISS